MNVMFRNAPNLLTVHAHLVKNHPNQTFSDKVKKIFVNQIISKQTHYEPILLKLAPITDFGSDKKYLTFEDIPAENFSQLMDQSKFIFCPLGNPGIGDSTSY